MVVMFAYVTVQFVIWKPAAHYKWAYNNYLACFETGHGRVKWASLF